MHESIIFVQFLAVIITNLNETPGKLLET